MLSWCGHSPHGHKSWRRQWRIHTHFICQPCGKWCWCIPVVRCVRSCTWAVLPTGRREVYASKVRNNSKFHGAEDSVMNSWYINRSSPNLLCVVRKSFRHVSTTAAVTAMPCFQAPKGHPKMSEIRNSELHSTCAPFGFRGIMVARLKHNWRKDPT